MKTIAKFSWSRWSYERLDGITKKWLTYCSECQEDPLEMNIRTILKFMHFATHKLKLSHHFIKTVRRFAIESRQLAGKPLTQNDLTYLAKFLKASFNEKPPVPRSQPFAWDVNIVLEYFLKLGPNKFLPYITLVGKTILLIMLSSMCRLAEIRQLKISQMAFGLRGITVKLLKLTKTVNFKNCNMRNHLQNMEILRFAGNPLLCPVSTITDYMTITSHCRGYVDELFVLFQKPSKAAAPYTIGRWAKRIMTEDGVGAFEASSAWASSVSCAVLSGVPLNQLVGFVGWTTASTFVRSYLKPVVALGPSPMPTPAPTPTVSELQGNNVAQKSLPNKVSVSKLLQGNKNRTHQGFKVPTTPMKRGRKNMKQQLSDGKIAKPFKDTHNFSKLWKTASTTRGRTSYIDVPSVCRLSAYMQTNALTGIKNFLLLLWGLHLQRPPHLMDLCQLP